MCQSVSLSLKSGGHDDSTTVAAWTVVRATLLRSEWKKTEEEFGHGECGWEEIESQIRSVPREDWTDFLVEWVWGDSRGFKLLPKRHC